VKTEVVMGRFRELIPDDLILLAIFVRDSESENTRAKCQGVDSGSPRVPNQILSVILKELSILSSLVYSTCIIGGMISTRIFSYALTVFAQNK
jgi:hypothetical protein